MWIELAFKIIKFDCALVGKKFLALPLEIFPFRRQSQSDSQGYGEDKHHYVAQEKRSRLEQHIMLGLRTARLARRSREPYV